jgi:hypothetical protein
LTLLDLHEIREHTNDEVQGEDHGQNLESYDGRFAFEIGYVQILDVKSSFEGYKHE